MFQVVAYPDHGSKHEAPSGSQKKKNKRKKKTHVSMTDHGIRDEWSTRKDGERGEQGNQVWEVSRRHFASPWLSNRYCTLETIQKGSASRARERCLCLRPMLHGNHAGAPLLPPFYSFPLCTMRCSVILLPLTFMLLSDRMIDRRFLFSKNSHN